MREAIPFTKMQGLGNDFVVIDAREWPIARRRRTLAALVEAAPELADRRFGIGFDQLLWLEPGTARRLGFRVLDADGSFAEMCGNGIRAAHRLVGARRIVWDTDAGEVVTERASRDRVRVRMREPEFPRGLSFETVRVANRAFAGVRVSMGNPHFVLFRADAERELATYGPLLERHRAFPERTNVEWVRVRKDGRLRMDVWERGSGRTLACGTGACASAAAAIALGKVKRSRLSVEMPGGELEIEWDGTGEPLWMTGPAEVVYRGAFTLPLERA